LGSVLYLFGRTQHQKGLSTVPELSLHFETNEQPNPEEFAALQKALQERITHLPQVDEVDTVLDEPQGVEMLAALATTIILVKSGGDLVTQLRVLIQQLTGLVKDVGEFKKAFKKVSIDVGPKRVPITELTDQDFQQIAASSASKV
jgi:hypothetical protein